MQKSFSDFVSQQNQEVKNEKLEQAKKKVQTEDMSGFEDLIRNYSNYSEEELIQEFLRLTQEGKKKGTLNAESLRKLSETVRPMLNAKQQKMLDMYLNYIN